MKMLRTLCLSLLLIISGAVIGQEEEMTEILSNESLTYDQKLEAFYEMIKKHSPEMAVMLDDPASKQILEQQFKQMAAYHSLGKAMEAASANKQQRTPSSSAPQKKRVDPEAQRQAMLKEREAAQQEMLRQREQADKSEKQQQYVRFLQSIPQFPGELAVKSAFDIKDVRPGDALHDSVTKLYKEGFTELSKSSDAFSLTKHTELDSSQQLEEKIILKVDDQAPGSVLEMFYYVTVRNGRAGHATLYPGLDFHMVQKSLIEKFGSPLTAKTSGFDEYRRAGAAGVRTSVIKRSSRFKYLGLDCEEVAKRFEAEAASFLEKRKASVLKRECRTEQKKYSSTERSILAKAEAAYEQSLKSVEFKNLDICGYLDLSDCPSETIKENGFLGDDGYVYVRRGLCNIWVEGDEVLSLCKAGREKLSTRIHISPKKVKAAWEEAITQTKEVAPAVEISL